MTDPALFDRAGAGHRPGSTTRGEFMAGWGFERMSRPAPSAEAPTLMPPHIQEAEQRTERRARRTLRALVVGGLAGVAWLLTGAAAHATDVTSSVIVHEPGGTTVDAVPSEVASPSRLTGGPADLERHIPGRNTPDAVGEHPVVERPGDERPVERAGSPRARQAFRAGRAFRPGRHHQAAHRRPAVASATADGPVPDRRNTRGGDGPAPLRPYLGASTGGAAVGTATPMEGGCAAFLPAAIADSTMACHPLPIATDGAARRHDAEAPTVSPD